MILKIIASYNVDISIETGLNLTNHFLCGYEEKQVLRKRDGSRRHIAGLHNLSQLFALLCRQTHLVLLNRHNRIVLYVIQHLDVAKY